MVIGVILKTVFGVQEEAQIYTISPNNNYQGWNCIAFAYYL